MWFCSLLMYLLKSNVSNCSEVNKTKTTADHCDEDNLAPDRPPDLTYFWTSFTREWSPSSFKQWNRLMDFSGEGFILILVLMYSTVFSSLYEMFPACVRRYFRSVWLDSSERPRRNRRKRSRCPFLLCKALSTALWCRSDIVWQVKSCACFELRFSLSTSLLSSRNESSTYRAARCSWMLRWTKQKTFPWYQPNSSLKIWVHNPE